MWIVVFDMIDFSGNGKITMDEMVRWECIDSNGI